MLKPIIALAAAGLLAGACTTTGNTERNAAGGAALGALAGAAIGAVSGDVGVGTGAAVGAAVGGTVGAVKGCREDGGCGASSPNRRQYYDERAGRYYYYDSATGRDAAISVYFEKDVAELTPEGRKIITEAARRANACSVTSVSVLGLADATGDPATNLELSRKRASAVTTALAAAGVTAELQVDAKGDAGSLTGDGAAAPLRRRTDITFHVAKPK